MSIQIERMPAQKAGGRYKTLRAHRFCSGLTVTRLSGR
jgi:hypothetical protein